MANKNVNILLKLQDQFTRPMRQAGVITREQEKSMRRLSQTAIGFSQNVRSSFVSITKHAVAAGAALGGVAATITGLAVKEYSAYEQLTGGIQTMFEDLSVDVQKNALGAFKTAGLSANEYMETAMGFAASLNASLVRTEGNIRNAASYTDMAIIDMADNSNKMGTAIESIQNAYQGFAKQNFTMLDNLKLGYGGTQKEMQRLLGDATKLSGVKYDISNSSDIVQAIHVIQGNLGVTGTTAKEAMSTISGSIGATRSAWKNLLAGIAIPDADVGTLVDNVITSAGVVVRNIAPVAVRALKSGFQAMKAAFPAIRDEVNSLINDLVPPKVKESIDKVKAGVLSAWKTIKPVIGFAIDHANTLIPAVLGVVGAISSISVVADVANNIHGLVTGFSDAREAVGGVRDIISAKGGLLPALKGLITTGFGPVGIAIAAVVAAGVLLYKHWDVIKPKLIALKDAFVSAFTKVRDVVTGVFEKIKSIAMPILDAIKTALEKIKGFIDTVKTGLGDLGFGSGSSWGANPGSFRDLGGKATGTPYWRGGPTYVNEGRRGEIINLPSGTQIIPHDVSMAAAQSGGGRNITVNLNIAGNVIGNREYADQLSDYICRKLLNAMEVTA